MTTLRAWLERGPFGLGMSSGFFGFFAHAGFLSVLEEEGFVPSRLGGSSAGALVTGCFASGLEVSAIAETFLSLQRTDFWDPAPGFGLLRGRLFRRQLEQTLPVQRIEDCPLPLAVSTYDVVSRRTRVYDRGNLAAAIHASCALPGFFQPVWIHGRPHLDGGIADRPGLEALPENERVLYHHLASRSPWRRRDSPSLKVPHRKGLKSVVIEGLPRVNPFRLERGMTAFEASRRAAQRALDLPFDGDVVRLAA
ncbi:MAG: patatin-like phospholipase family protein [Myxococcota bacterium]